MSKKSWYTIKRAVSVLLVMTMCCAVVTTSFAENTQKSDRKHLTADKIEVLPDGGKLYTYIINGVRNVFPVPPTGFKPIEATDAELAQYGFPPRPEVDTELAAWNKQMSYYKYTPEPDISVGVERTYGVAKDVVTKPDSIYATSGNWSGYVATGNFVQVQGDFTQPTIATDCASNTYEGTWVGIGGWTGSNKLVQTGTGMDTINGRRHYDAWFEYLSAAHPNPPVYMNSLTINGGNSIHTYCSFQSSNNLFNAYIANNTNGTSQTALVDISASEYFDSSTAEWINERPTLSDGTISWLADLTKYGSHSWSTCQAYKNTGSWFNIASLAYSSIDMKRGTTTCASPSGLSGGSFTSNWYAY